MAVCHVSLRVHLAGSLPTKAFVSGITGLAGHKMSGACFMWLCTTFHLGFTWQALCPLRLLCPFWTHLGLATCAAGSTSVHAIAAAAASAIYKILPTIMGM